MHKNLCKNCRHFSQHYALVDRGVFWVYCGHCKQGKVRKELPDCSACDHFLPALPDKETFATKEYLSKRLVEYMLQMELLPPIQDASDKP